MNSICQRENTGVSVNNRLDDGESISKLEDTLKMYRTETEKK